jgi:hypothetical protein
MMLFAFLVTLGFVGLCFAAGFSREHRRADGEE